MPTTWQLKNKKTKIKGITEKEDFVVNNYSKQTEVWILIGFPKATLVSITSLQIYFDQTHMRTNTSSTS